MVPRKRSAACPAEHADDDRPLQRSPRRVPAFDPVLTEGEGFEPSSEESPPKRFSRPPHSTALPPLQGPAWRTNADLRRARWEDRAETPRRATELSCPNDAMRRTSSAARRTPAQAD